MENAAKALLIAGGVLIAIIIITMFIIMYTRVADIQHKQEEQKELEQLTAFNAEYEAYNKKIMYVTDVITLINKVAENNKKYAGNSQYLIEITVNGTVKTNSTDLIGNVEEKKTFKCEKIEYNDLGRVCSIKIVSRE